MKTGKQNSESLGNRYEDNEYIVRQGERGECMYEILEGKVKVLNEEGDEQILLQILGKGEFFGEMAIFDRKTRSASVRSFKQSRILTIDRKLLLRRISKDPTLAFRILEKMSGRIRDLDEKVVRLERQRVKL